jgi:2-aminoadipate transaminase
MKSHSLSTLSRRTKEPPISWLMATALANPNLISLAAGFTDQASLPVKETTDLVHELLCSPKTGPAALQYGTTIGDPVLRELTASRLKHLDEVPAASPAVWSAERMIITNGSQQMLYMVTEALCDPGDVVLVEDPSYFVYLGILQSHGVHARGVRMEQDGLDLAHLEQVLEGLRRKGRLARLKLLYLVSYYQNPTGITTSFEKKQGALKLLRQFERLAGHPLYLLEDAAYRELRFRGEHVKSALAADPSDERVIYTGTYSKPFATGARVGFGLLPKAVYTPVVRIKGNHDFGSSNLLQQLLTRALACGIYESHLAVLRNRYAQKAKIMRKHLHQQFPPAVEWREPQGGLYFWPRLPHRLKSGPHSRLFQEALKKNVLYVPGQLCYAEDPSRPKPNNEMRLSFGAASERNICTGIERLGKALHQLL